MTVQWYSPIEHKECVHKYRVCYKLLPFGSKLIATRLGADEKCVETPLVVDFDAVNTFIIEDLEPCANYRVRIAALTANGLVGIDSAHEDYTALEGERRKSLQIAYLFCSCDYFLAPGEPADFQVARIDGNDVYLVWNKPETNPWCVQRSVHL